MMKLTLALLVVSLCYVAYVKVLVPVYTWFGMRKIKLDRGLARADKKFKKERKIK